jgi:cobalt-zinc-cadmium resistance protein CzcA
MIDGILSFSIRQRWLVMIGVLLMAALGAWNFTRLPIDAVPEITNVQVQINTKAPGFSPLEASSASRFRSRPAWAACPTCSTPGRCRATA